MREFTIDRQDDIAEECFELARQIAAVIPRDTSNGHAVISLGLALGGALRGADPHSLRTIITMVFELATVADNDADPS